MEEKLKRLKQFNSKLKQPSQRKERKWRKLLSRNKAYKWCVQPSQSRTCRWCKKEIQPSAYMCSSCQQPQKKRHWFLAHPSVAVSTVSIIIALGSFVVAWKANNHPPASPKLDAQVIAYTDEGFSFLVYNYGEAPTILTAVDLSTYLERSTLHEGHAYFSLETPVPLPPSSNQTINIRYDSHQANWADWNFSDGEEPFSISNLNLSAGMSNDLKCEMKLWYSAPDTKRHRASFTSISNGNCTSAMEWMSQEFGPLKDNPLSDPVLRFRAHNGSPDT